MQRANIEGRTIAYTTHGPINGVPLFLVHGFPLRGSMWDEQARVLGDILGYRVVIPDLRGYGDSGPVNAAAIMMDEFALDVLDMADYLGIDRFVLGGISMGGYISFALLRRAQARIVGLILADTRATPDTPDAQLAREQLARHVEADGSIAAVDAMVPRFFAPATYAEKPALIARATTMITTTPAATIAATARGLALRPDSTALLNTITCPTLILCGGEDVLTPPTEAASMVARIPNARQVLLPEAGHIANWEDPAAFTAALAGFLEGLR